MRAQITMIEAQIDSLKSTELELKSRSELMKANLVSDQSQLNSLADQIASSQSEASKLRSTLESVQDELSKVTEELNVKQEELSSIDKQIATAKDSLREHTNTETDSAIGTEQLNSEDVWQALNEIRELGETVRQEFTRSDKPASETRRIENANAGSEVPKPSVRRADAWADIFSNGGS